MQKPFSEPQCEVGGCACGAWNDWWMDLRDRAKNAPGAPDPVAFPGTPDGRDAYSEAVDDFALDDCAEQMPVPVSTQRCARPGSCPWAQHS